MSKNDGTIMQQVEPELRHIEFLVSEIRLSVDSARRALTNSEIRTRGGRVIAHLKAIIGNCNDSIELIEERFDIQNEIVQKMLDFERSGVHAADPPMSADRKENMSAARRLLGVCSHCGDSRSQEGRSPLCAPCAREKGYDT